MNFLLDTCVLSEGAKPRPDPNVIAWMTTQEPDRLYISAVSLGELYYGIACLPGGKRRDALGDWLGDVEARFAGRVIVLDEVTASRWGLLRAKNKNAPTVDTQIAASAMTYGFTLVTRNVKDFAFEGLAIINPWKA